MKDVCDHRAKMLTKFSMHLRLNCNEFVFSWPPLHYIYQKLLPVYLEDMDPNLQVGTKSAHIWKQSKLLSTLEGRYFGGLLPGFKYLEW